MVTIPIFVFLFSGDAPSSLPGPCADGRKVNSAKILFFRAKIFFFILQALHLAAFQGHALTVAKLIELGADPNIQTTTGSQPKPNLNLNLNLNSNMQTTTGSCFPTFFLSNGLFFPPTVAKRKELGRV